MARLSLWKEGKHTNDYRFFDRRISEFMSISGTGVLLHKYLGPMPQTQGQPDQPANTNTSELNIQDLLFLENRDRKYEPDVYRLRGVYQVTDNSFDLSQFGLFLQTGTLFITFHINDMVGQLGRKIMNGDVLELEHLLDYHTLDPDLPAALKRFFVATDCTRASEGYGPSWWPHLWRVKISPLVDSQEYKDIINKIAISDDDNRPIRDIISSYNSYIQVNDAIIEQAEQDVPASGYDLTPIYHRSGDTDTPDFAVNSYMGSSVGAPNGANVVQGISFPQNPEIGDYCLRVDYLPNRLFRYNGTRWMAIEDKVRTNLTNAAEDNRTLRNTFINNDRVFTDVRGREQPEKQNLNDILKPRAD